jgi:hypothetical protein
MGSRFRDLAAPDSRGQPQSLDLGFQARHQREGCVIPAVRQPVRQQSVAALGEHRFRVELHAGDRVAGMTQPHDGPVESRCGDLDVVGERAVDDGKGVVPGGRERLRQPPEQALAVVLHL